MLVPTYDVQRRNPALHFEKWNLALPETTMPWPSRGRRRISVNSFGFGGANAHVIMDDAFHYLSERGLVGNHNTVVDEDDSSESGISVTYPSTPTSSVDLGPVNRVFVLSSRDQAGIQRLFDVHKGDFENLKLARDDEHYLSDLAYTLSERRTHHDYRAFAVASSLSELATELAATAPKRSRSSRTNTDLLFVFTGQGAQWAAMGAQLMCQPVFAQSVQESRRFLVEYGCEWDALEELSKTEGSRIVLPEFSQTLCTVLQVALVDLLRSWGVAPSAVVGHSSGEIAAAYAASYISHADAVRIAYARGVSSASVPREGAMMAAGLSREEAKVYLAQVPEGSAVVACVNSPQSVTLSGDVAAIDALEKSITADEKFARKLKVKTAYHSPHMMDVADSYIERMGHIEQLPGNSNVVMYSSLTGKIVQPGELDAHYWKSNMCNTVEFADAVAGILAHDVKPSGASSRTTRFRWGGVVEVGPHAALKGPVQQSFTAAANKLAKEAPYVSLVVRGQDASKTALSAVGDLWSGGINIDWRAVNQIASWPLSQPKTLVELPSYAWNHSRRFWHEASSTRFIRYPEAPRTDLLGMPEGPRNPMEPRWRNYLRVSENPWIDDHKITGTTLYPGAGMLVMALEGALQISDSSKQIHGFRFSNVSFERGLVVTDGDEAAVETRLSLLPDRFIPNQYGFRVFSYNGSAWTLHCYGTISVEYAKGLGENNEEATDAVWQSQSRTYQDLADDATKDELDIDDFYEHLESKGMEYGPAFRNVVSLTSVPAHKAAYGTITTPDTKSDMPAQFEYPHVIHPATLDAIFHLLLATASDGKPTEEAAVPFGLEDMFISAKQPQGAGTKFLGFSQLTATNPAAREVSCSLVVSDSEWSGPKIVASGFHLRQVTSSEGDAASTGVQSGTKKSATVDWQVDTDFFPRGDSLAKLLQSSGKSLLGFWLDCLTHKKAIDDALFVTGDENVSSGVSSELTRLVGRQPGIGKLTTSRLSDEAPVPTGAYNLAVVAGDDSVNHVGLAQTLAGSLAPEGVVIVHTSQPHQAGKWQAAFEQKELVTSTISVSEGEAIVVVQQKASTETIHPGEVYFLQPDQVSLKLETLISAAADKFTSAGYAVHRATLWSASLRQSVAGKHVVSFLEAENPLVYSWSEDEFNAFKTIISSLQHILWVTRGSLLESWSGGVEFAPAQGLLRVLRNEYPLASLAHLDLSAAIEITKPAAVDLLFGVWGASLGESAEKEYAELHGNVHIPRAVGHDGFDGDLQLFDGTAQPVRRPISSIDRPMRLDSSVGGNDFLWVEDELAAELTPGQVEVSVEYVSLGSGLDGARDASSLSTSRYDAVGAVRRTGTDVTHLEVGQRVVVFQTEGCRTVIRAESESVVAAPADLPAEEIAALALPLVVARYAIAEVAGLEAGQTLLVHNATSSLGQAAIQVARAIGVQFFALVESEADRNLLAQNLAVDTAHILDSSRRSFVQSVVQATQGQGVDAIIADQQSPAMVWSADLLSDAGYFLDLSTSHSGNANFPSVPSLKRNASLIRINPQSLQGRRLATMKSLFKTVFTQPFAAIQPTTVVTVESLPQVVSTASSSAPRTLVLSLGPDAAILTMPTPVEQLQLDPNGTYVLAGGLGALGLNIANMMADRGAKHLVFLSRSGGSKNQEDLDRFQERGILAEAFKCNVNDKVALDGVFRQLRSQGRVIRGVVQCAMVLEVTHPPRFPRVPSHFAYANRN
jgi:acyl transferase domain-containing protein/NADPH:quinone reductase-like Zn-dependent oxidoreductase